MSCPLEIPMPSSQRTPTREAQHPPLIANTVSSTLGYMVVGKKGDDDLRMAFFNVFLKPAPRGPPLEVDLFPLFKELLLLVHPIPPTIVHEDLASPTSS